jgi:hypothetical protein
MMLTSPFARERSGSKDACVFENHQYSRAETGSADLTVYGLRTLVLDDGRLITSGVT